MSERPCEVEAIGWARLTRLIDRMVRGHDLHTCMRNRPAFGVWHTGDHECACGLRWSPQAMDDLRRPKRIIEAME